MILCICFLNVEVDYDFVNKSVRLSLVHIYLTSISPLSGVHVYKITLEKYV